MLNVALESFTIAEMRIDDKRLNKRKKRPRLANCRVICYGKNSVLRRAVQHNDCETPPRMLTHFFITII
ncbi:hypothetical protein B9Z55_013594 [Caenorhabditis nigoni]|uniref:Uncharacterized protein n=1 Tax=Caenorhabditis nigoni TaxID=1611254 RepID=A0A2G5U2M3_9PELO|nr:hypothetical protein B9Z55_013594 [Caenorhabditis nigoni]